MSEKSVYQRMAENEGWSITLDHNDCYVAHDNVVDEPAYRLDADNEEDAWKELCALEHLEVGCHD